mgnify:FL=1
MANPHPVPKRHGAVDVISRGRIRYLYSLFIDEFREDIWKALIKCLKHKNPRINLMLIQEMADRLEGRAVQPHEITEKRSTTFVLAEGTVILRDGAPAAEEGEEAGYATLPAPPPPRDEGDDGWRPPAQPPEPTPP